MALASPNLIPPGLNDNEPLFRNRVTAALGAVGVFLGEVAEALNVTATDVTVLNGVTVVGAMTALAADPDRKALTVRNDSDAKMYLRLDGTAGNGVGYPLDVGRGYEFPQNMVPKGAVSIWCASATKAWAIFHA